MITSSGFINKAEFSDAQKLGIGNKREFSAYQEYESYRKENNLSTHDEVLLHRYLRAHIAELNIKTVKLKNIIAMLTKELPRSTWYIKGLENYELFEKMIIAEKNAGEFYYNKDLDVFQESPLIFSKTEIVLDGSNIAWNNGSSEHGDKPLIRNVILVTKDLLNKGFISIQIYFDANIEYVIEDKQLYKQLENTFNIKKVPSGEKADKYILDYAKENKTYVISNDRYLEYVNMDKWFEMNLHKITVQFKIEGDNVHYNKTIEK
jgi:hypothetical protein